MTRNSGVTCRIGRQPPPAVRLQGFTCTCLADVSFPSSVDIGAWASRSPPISRANVESLANRKLNGLDSSFSPCAFNGPPQMARTVSAATMHLFYLSSSQRMKLHCRIERWWREIVFAFFFFHLFFFTHSISRLTGADPFRVTQGGDDGPHAFRMQGVSGSGLIIADYTHFY